MTTYDTDTKRRFKFIGPSVVTKPVNDVLKPGDMVYLWVDQLGGVLIMCRGCFKARVSPGKDWHD
jgi:hypothetical protein